MSVDCSGAFVVGRLVAPPAAWRPDGVVRPNCRMPPAGIFLASMKGRLCGLAGLPEIVVAASGGDISAKMKAREPGIGIRA